MTVLLVEPSRSQAVIIRGYLQKLGFQEIPTTPSGQKALELACNAPPQVVISAMHLADMTGVQLAQKMRAEGPLSSAGFVLITSQADTREANLLGQAGHVIRLPKPFDLDQLAKALAAASGKSGEPIRTGPARTTILRSVEEKLEYVAAGHGIIVLPLSATQYYTRPDIVYVPVTDAEPDEVLLAHEAARRSKLITAFIAAARAEVR